MDAVNEAEQARLHDWLHSHDEYIALVARAVDLGEQHRAA
jgi:hypothetical protein